MRISRHAMLKKLYNQGIYSLIQSGLSWCKSRLLVVSEHITLSPCTEVKTSPLKSDQTFIMIKSSAILNLHEVELYLIMCLKGLKSFLWEILHFGFCWECPDIAPSSQEKYKWSSKTSHSAAIKIKLQFCIQAIQTFVLYAIVPLHFQYIITALLVFQLINKLINLVNKEISDCLLTVIVLNHTISTV